MDTCITHQYRERGSLYKAEGLPWVSDFPFDNRHRERKNPVLR